MPLFIQLKVDFPCCCYWWCSCCCCCVFENAVRWFNLSCFRQLSSISSTSHACNAIILLNLTCQLEVNYRPLTVNTSSITYLIFEIGSIRSTHFHHSVSYLMLWVFAITIDRSFINTWDWIAGVGPSEKLDINLRQMSNGFSVFDCLRLVSTGTPLDVLCDTWANRILKLCRWWCVICTDGMFAVNSQ